MAIERYYVRWRGKLSGPFDVEELKEMAAQGRLSKLHDISADETAWRRAGTMEELFPRYELEGGAVPEHIPVSALVAVEAPAPEEQQAEPTEEDHSGWYYARDQVIEGPCPADAITRLLAAGGLTLDDVVSPSTGALAWRPIRDVPELANVTVSPSAAPTVQVPYAAAVVELVEEVSPDQEAYSRLADTSLKLGVVGIVVPVCGLIGLILAIKARSGLGPNGDSSGRSTAAVAIRLGIVDIVLDIAKFGIVGYLVTSVV